MKYRFIVTIALVSSLAALANAQQSSAPAAMESCPLHAQHQAEKEQAAHLAQVNRRGAVAMGFSQTKTTHHFRLYADGGAIEVTAKRANDAISRRQIRQHLQQIASSFAAGDFSKPQHTHAQVPPGVAGMTQFKAEVVYQYEALPRGARVRIRTANTEALAAVHDFLRFQISDHQTGDTSAVQP